MGRGGKGQRSEWLHNWSRLGLYDKFEQIVVLVLTALIAFVVAFAVWNLMKKVIAGMILTGTFDPTDYAVFSEVFGMIFAVIIAMEFKRSISVGSERKFGIVQVRVVILIAMLAIVRKLIIVDLTQIEAFKVVALSTGVLALGVVYWLVRDQDRKERKITTRATNSGP